MSASKVYFTDMRCPVGTSLLQKLTKLMHKAGIDAINASGMRSVGIGAGLTGAQLLLPSTDSLTWSRLSAFWQNV